MAPPSLNAFGDGRAHWRTDPGRAYQVHRRTTGLQGRRVGRPYHHRVPHRIAALASTRAHGLLLIAALLAGLVGCVGASFEPSGPCTTDGRVPGAYPDLEAIVPATFRGRAPDRLDSGRNCTPKALATLVAHGVSELRFAGANWDLGSSSGLTLAIFEAPRLDADWVAEFYEAGARTARRTESVEVTSVTIPDGSSGSRIDALNGESFQSVIVWPDGDRVRVALVGSFIRAVTTREAHNAVVDEALAAAITR
jgi:hypothetical protein